MGACLHVTMDNPELVEVLQGFQDLQHDGCNDTFLQPLQSTISKSLIRPKIHQNMQLSNTWAGHRCSWSVNSPWGKRNSLQTPRIRRSHKATPSKGSVPATDSNPKNPQLTG